jgi:hypothetical protein
MFAKEVHTLQYCLNIWVKSRNLLFQKISCVLLSLCYGLSSATFYHWCICVLFCDGVGMSKNTLGCFFFVIHFLASRNVQTIPLLRHAHFPQLLAMSFPLAFFLRILDTTAPAWRRNYANIPRQKAHQTNLHRSLGFVCKRTCRQNPSCYSQKCREGTPVWH